MTVYLLKQKTVAKQPSRMCAVLAGDKGEAIDKAELDYGGDWSIMETHKTLEELRIMVEDSATNTMLINI